MLIGIMVFVILFILADIDDILRRIEKRLKAEFKEVPLP